MLVCCGHEQLATRAIQGYFKQLQLGQLLQVSTTSSCTTISAIKARYPQLRHGAWRHDASPATSYTLARQSWLQTFQLHNNNTPITSHPLPRRLDLPLLFAFTVCSSLSRRLPHVLSDELRNSNYTMGVAHEDSSPHSRQVCGQPAPSPLLCTSPGDPCLTAHEIMVQPLFTQIAPGLGVRPFSGDREVLNHRSGRTGARTCGHGMLSLFTAVVRA